MAGKRGVIMGVANNRSIAWGIAKAMADEGAELAFSYQGEAFGKRVLPLIDDVTPGAKAFVGSWLKAYPGRDPASEMSLNYTAMLATAQAMKLAGTTSDAVAIRANLDKAFKSLKVTQNPNNLDGVDARGGSTAKTRVAVVENGKTESLVAQAQELLNSGG